MATLTSTVFANNVPKYRHGGDLSISGQFNSGATAVASGDIVFLAKIPAGATIVDVIEDHSTGATGYAVSFGMTVNSSSTYSCFIASGAQATVNRRSVVGLPFHVSTSDDAAANYGILVAKSEASTTTTSLFINFTVIYRMDGP